MAQRRALDRSADVVPSVRLSYLAERETRRVSGPIHDGRRANLPDGCLAVNVRRRRSNGDVRISLFTDEFQFNTQHMERYVSIHHGSRGSGFLANFYADTLA